MISDWAPLCSSCSKVTAERDGIHKKRWIIYNWLLLYVSGLKSMLIRGSHCKKGGGDGGGGAAQVLSLSFPTALRKESLCFHQWPDFHVQPPFPHSSLQCFFSLPLPFKSQSFTLSFSFCQSETVVNVTLQQNVKLVCQKRSRVQQ